MKDTRERQFYVYLLRRPSGKVFYVGKGCDNRADAHEREARKGCKCHKCRVIRKIWSKGGKVVKEFVYWTDNEVLAYKVEAQYIAAIGLDNLTNIDPGDAWIVNKHRHVYADVPEFMMTLTEAVHYLKRSSKTDKEYRKRLMRWLNARITYLERERKRCRAFGRNWDTSAIDAEMTDLAFTFGWCDQEVIDF